MGCILVANHISLDGVMQGPGRADEDTRDGFTAGGWAISDPAGAEAMGERMAAGGGLSGWLLGRRSYEDVLGWWTHQPGPFGDGLLNTDKYVVSSTLTEPAPYANTTVLRGDVAEAVRAVRDAVDGTLVVLGSGRLIETLLAHELIDELLLFVNPLVLGGGHRLFPADGPSSRWRCRAASLTQGGLLVTDFVPG